MELTDSHIGSNSNPEESTKCFLFSDIEGSTELWENAPKEMHLNLKLHNQIIENIVDSWSGTVFKRVGDATCSVFDEPALAVGCAIECALAIRAAKWEPQAKINVRWALHRGQCHSEADDFSGPALNFVSRLVGLAHPGQILASETIETTDPSRCRFLCFRSLKGIATHAKVFQLLDDRLPHKFTVLPGEESKSSNFPNVWNRFIGRESEVNQLRELISDHRLVTVIGPGGAGKSRLATEVAKPMNEKFELGVKFIPLSNVSEKSAVLPMFCSSFSSKSQAIPDMESLTATIGDNSALIIVDNCEHLGSAPAKLITQLLVECPGVKVLATSRIPLQIAGEVRMRIGNLPIPTEPTVESVRESEAAQLFADRATAVTSEFELSEKTCQWIWTICKKLDGIPLALELAAAQLSSIYIEDLVKVVEERPLSIESEDPTELAHRKTIDSMIDWSYRMLSPSEQETARFMSLFSSCTKEALFEVLGRDASQDLHRLVNCSLVNFDRESKRYSMLELVHEFLMVRLKDAQEWESAHEKLLDWLVGFAEEARPKLDGEDQVEWLDRLEAEHDNVRAAFASKRNPDALLRIASALHWFWFLRGHLNEGKGWLGSILDAHVPTDQDLHAKAEGALGSVLWFLGESDLAEVHFKTAYDRGGNSSDLKTKATVNANLALILAKTVPLTETEPLFLEALAAFEKLGELTKVATIRHNLATLYSEEERLDDAVTQFKLAIQILVEQGDVVNSSIFQFNLAITYLDCDQETLAMDTLRTSITNMVQLKHYSGLAQGLMNLARLAEIHKRWRICALIHGKVDQLLRANETPKANSSLDYWYEMIDKAKAQLDPEEYVAQYDLGSQQSTQAILDKF